MILTYVQGSHDVVKLKIIIKIIERFIALKYNVDSINMEDKEALMIGKYLIFDNPLCDTDNDS